MMAGGVSGNNRAPVYRGLIHCRPLLASGPGRTESKGVPGRGKGRPEAVATSPGCPGRTEAGRARKRPGAWRVFPPMEPCFQAKSGWGVVAH